MNRVVVRGVRDMIAVVVSPVLLMGFRSGLDMVLRQEVEGDLVNLECENHRDRHMGE